MWHSSPKKIITSNKLKQFLMKYYEERVVKNDPDKCWYFEDKRRNYYPRININGRSCTAHRVVFEIFFGYPPKDKPYVLHSCDEKSCVNPNHLRCGTTRDNQIDRRFTGRKFVVSERDVKVIKYMRHLNYTYKEVGNKFDISISKVRDICLDINTPGILPIWYNPM